MTEAKRKEASLLRKELEGKIKEQHPSMSNAEIKRRLDLLIAQDRRP